MCEASFIQYLAVCAEKVAYALLLLRPMLRFRAEMRRNLKKISGGLTRDVEWYVGF